MNDRMNDTKFDVKQKINSISKSTANQLSAMNLLETFLRFEANIMINGCF